jgi:hypothetical protein
MCSGGRRVQATGSVRPARLSDPVTVQAGSTSRLARSGAPVAEVSGALVMVELKGLTRLVGPMSYIRVR